MSLPLIAAGVASIGGGLLFGGGNEQFQLPAAPTFDQGAIPNRADLDRFLSAFRDQTFQQISQSGEDFRTQLASRGIVRSGEAEERFFRDIQNPALAELNRVAAQGFLNFSQLQANTAISRFNTEANIFNTTARINFSDFTRRQENNASIGQGLGDLGGTLLGTGLADEFPNVFGGG